MVPMIPAMMLTLPMAMGTYFRESSGKYSVAKLVVPVMVDMMMTGIVNHAFHLE